MANVTKHLRVGQKVNVIDMETGCRIAVAEEDASALTITETAFDYLVLEDAAGEVKTRLPTYLVRSVTAPEDAAPVEEVPVPVTADTTAPVAVEMPAPVAVEPVVPAALVAEVPANLVSEAA